MFAQASRIKLRFATPKGALTPDDLWDLPLTSQTGKANLDDIAKDLFRVLKADDNVSFVEPDRKSDPTTQLAFDIVKHIIGVKLAENAAAAAAKSTAQRKQLLLGIIEQKQNEALTGMTLDELRAEVNKL